MVGQSSALNSPARALRMWPLAGALVEAFDSWL